MIGSGGFVAVGGTVSALMYDKAPWWAIALAAVVLTTLSVVLAIARLLLPQDSHDLLQWWRDLRRYRTERRLAKSASRRAGRDSS